MASFGQEEESKAPLSEENNNVEQTHPQYLCGHRDTILCLDIFNQNLASGSDDSTVRIWDLENPTSGASMCICRCFENFPVNSVAFSTSFSSDFKLFAAAGGTIYVFDLSSKRVLVTSSEMQYNLSSISSQRLQSKKKKGRSQLECKADEEEDEINQISVHPKTGQYLCAALDSGAVVVLDLTKPDHPKVMRKHANICSTAIFHPRTQWDLASGGYDQKLFFWDFSRGRPTGSSDLRAQQQTQQQGGVSQVVNPPFVHSLAYNSDGRYLAAGLGDGSIVIFEQRSRSCVATAPDAHGAAVSQVNFAKYADNILISAGNDRLLHVWDLTKMLTNDNSSEVADVGDCSLLRTLALEEKPNWICTGIDGLIYVSDVSDKISVFHL